MKTWIYSAVDHRMTKFMYTQHVPPANTPKYTDFPWMDKLLLTVVLTRQPMNPTILYFKTASPYTQIGHTCLKPMPGTCLFLRSTKHSPLMFPVFPRSLALAARSLSSGRHNGKFLSATTGLRCKPGSSAHQQDGGTRHEWNEKSFDPSKVIYGLSSSTHHHHHLSHRR